MSEFGGDIYTPGEGATGAPEALSEEAKQRFAAAGAAMQQIRREEKKSKKRDDQVARTIIQFLNDEQHAHLFVLISRLVARDCPSVFILAVISLIDESSLNAVEDYLGESTRKSAKEMSDEGLLALTTGGELDAEMNHLLIEWITRMQMVLALSPDKILLRLMVDDKNIDGTVLQLTTFVLQEFFETRGRVVEFEKLQPLTASILQTVFQPFIGGVRKILAERAESSDEDDDD
jgi:hypothetical protein